MLAAQRFYRLRCPHPGTTGGRYGLHQCVWHPAIFNQCAFTCMTLCSACRCARSLLGASRRESTRSSAPAMRTHAALLALWAKLGAHGHRLGCIRCTGASADRWQLHRGSSVAACGCKNLWQLSAADTASCVDQGAPRALPNPAVVLLMSACRFFGGPV